MIRQEKEEEVWEGMEIRELEQELEKIVNDVGKIDVANIVGEVMEHSARYAYFVGLYERLKAEEERLKFVLKVVEAEVDRELRKRGEAGKVTERQLEKMVVLDERYRQAFDNWLEVKERVGLVRAVVVALDHKRDMINNAVLLVRDEMKGKLGLFSITS